MIEVLVIMSLGIGVGILLRKHRQAVRTVEKLITVAIFLLLFLLGVAVGTNQTIIHNLPSLGIKALLISLGAIGGSIALSNLVFKKLLQSVLHPNTKETTSKRTSVEEKNDQ